MERGGGGGGKSANLVLRVLSEPSVTVGEKKGQGKNYQMNLTGIITLLTHIDILVTG